MQVVWIVGLVTNTALQPCCERGTRIALCSQTSLVSVYKPRESSYSKTPKDWRRARCCMILCPLFLQEEVGNTTGNDIVYCDLLN